MSNKQEELITVNEARGAALHDAYVTTRTQQEFVDKLLPIMTITEAELKIAWVVLDYVEDMYGIL